uniref:DNA-directed DNA polymerase n=1 Tax=Tanacetum cinerariifolium TaxID=118510 RepID=A0A6L2KEB5_TANCI|nr:DNA-directed DNA polymerase [Tanacetum cinerariifolium]
MRTRSSSNLIVESFTIRKRRNSRCSKKIVKPELRTIIETPIATMADTCTMSKLLQAPIEGYGDAIITSTLKYQNVSNEAIKLMLFPFSLDGAAQIWLEKEPPCSILKWEDLVSKFVNHFFPPSKTTHLKNDITNFQQRFDESFGEARDRFKDLLRIIIPAARVFCFCWHVFIPAGVFIPTAIEETYVTYGEPHPYSECLATGGNTFDACAAVGTYNQGASTPLNKNYSAVLLKKLPEKLGDLGKFLIPCDFPKLEACLALADLGASINLMPLFVWKKLSLSELTSTCMTLKLANRSVVYLVAVAEDVFIKVGKFYFLADLVFIDYDVDPRVPLILRRPFLRTVQALIDVYGSDFILEEIETFLRTPDEISNLDDDYYDTKGDILYLKKLLNENPSLNLPPIKNEDLKQVDVTMTKPSIEEPPELELKDLPSHLEYAFLEGTDKLTIIISKELKDEEKAALLKFVGESRTLCAKKGGMTVVENEDNELIPTRLVTGWRIHIDPQDQEKTTFTCHYRRFAYRRMPFGLCNALGTCQRCMMAIFHDMIEETIEVFMDDFSVFGDSFSSCLSYLDKMLKRCEDTNLVLNWEKCHFMVKEGIFLGLKISIPGIEETPFIFSKECIEAFNTLKKKLTKALILVVPDWDLLLKIICDASDFVVEEENLAADQLSRLENPHQDDLEKKEINKTFPLKTLGMISSRSDSLSPCFADIANYHAGNFVVKGMSSQQKKKFFKDVKHYF